MFWKDYCTHLKVFLLKNNSPIDFNAKKYMFEYLLYRQHILVVDLQFKLLKKKKGNRS